MNCELLDRIFVDTHKEKSGQSRIPITPLSELEGNSDKYYVVISLLNKNEQIEQKLSEMGYSEDDYVYFVDL